MPLREAICDYVRRSRSVNCTPQQILITSGTQQGLYLAAQILLDAGDSAWVEDPAYAGITAIFDSLFRDRHMIRVPVADDSIDVAAGVRLAADAPRRLCHAVASISAGHADEHGEKRPAGLGQERQAWIVEDDYDSEMRYAGHPFPSLRGWRPNGRSISAPSARCCSLRCGWVTPSCRRRWSTPFAAPGS